MKKQFFSQLSHLTAAALPPCSNEADFTSNSYTFQVSEDYIPIFAKTHAKCAKNGTQSSHI